MPKLCEEAWTTFVLYFFGAPQKSVSVNIISTFLNHHKGRYKGSSKERWKRITGEKEHRRQGSERVVVHKATEKDEEQASSEGNKQY